MNKYSRVESGRIVDLVERHPDGISPSVVAERFGISPRAAATALKRLLDKGAIRRLRPGLYVGIKEI